jgi:hypothetical protein
MKPTRDPLIVVAGRAVAVIEGYLSEPYGAYAKPARELRSHLNHAGGELAAVLAKREQSPLFTETRDMLLALIQGANTTQSVEAWRADLTARAARVREIARGLSKQRAGSEA